MYAESLVALVGLLSLNAVDTHATSILRLNELPVARLAPVIISAPVKKNLDSQGVEITARSAVVLDAASGAVLFDKDMEAAYPIASLTKLVTAMTFLDRKSDLAMPIVMQESDEAEDGKTILPSGETFATHDVLRALLVGSVNAAGNALARSTGDTTAFIRAMNQKARALGMRHSTFTDPTGLDARNRASARDVAMALRAALEYPEIRDITEHENVDVKNSQGKSYHIKSTNLLLQSYLNKPPYRIVAAKTGSLQEAGYCLAQTTRQASGGDVIAVVLGSENHFVRFQDVKALTAWAFANFEWPKSATSSAALRLK